MLREILELLYLKFLRFAEVQPQPTGHAASHYPGQILQWVEYINTRTMKDFNS